MRETGKEGYMSRLIPRIISHFGADRCRVQRNNPNATGQQGIPDLTVFVDNRWFLLEVKASEKSSKRPNQDWWIERWSKVTYCAIIYPENEREVFDAVESALRS